jgi:hypothetical protein
MDQPKVSVCVPAQAACCNDVRHDGDSVSAEFADARLQYECVVGDEPV